MLTCLTLSEPFNRHIKSCLFLLTSVWSVTILSAAEIDLIAPAAALAVRIPISEWRHIPFADPSLHYVMVMGANSFPVSVRSLYTVLNDWTHFLVSAV